jgi:hypothetical protein
VEALQLHSKTQSSPVGQPFASHLGGSGLHTGDALTLTMEPGPPVSDVLLQAFQRCKLLEGCKRVSALKPKTSLSATNRFELFEVLELSR